MTPPPSGSLRRRIAALVALVLVLGVSSFGLLAYQAARDSIVEAADARLTDASNELARLFAGSFGTLMDSVEAAASAPALRDALRDPTGPPGEGALAALRRLGPLAGAVRRVELRDASGRPVASLPGSSERAVGSGTPDPVESVSVSPLFRGGDTVYYELRAPVATGDTLLGSLVAVRSVTTTPAAVERVAKLIGVEAGLVLGNADGSLWTDLVGVVDRPVGGSPAIYERDGQLRRSVSVPIGDLPIQAAVEFPQSMVSARPRELMGIFALLAVVVVALGALAGWLLTGPVTGSLEELALAADAIAEGDLDGATPLGAVAQEDEIGRLARSFQAMAVKVRDARDTLEHQVTERTAELELALTRLGDAQEELMRRERLAILGQLSGSVGHELRNPLGVMTNAIYYLERVVEDPSPKVERYLGVLRTQIELCDKIVTDLLDHARLKPPSRTRVSVPDLVEEQLQRVQGADRLSIEKRWPADLPDVEVDGFQIGQVLQNLFTNGAQAMQETGGTLTVGATAENGAVHVRVEDTGAGVAPEDRQKIFEPLFTTKARGIGLGLSVSRSLARANGGDLRLAEDALAGAAFVLTLPVAEETP